MSRSLTAVLVGTFTLRFSTGLTAGLLSFYLAGLEDFGGPATGAGVVALLTAAFYLTELTLSPLFGLLSDRLGTHRVMQYGPVFGAVAVVITFGTTDLGLLGGTRLLEGAAAAASIPSILGFLALVTSGDELVRGRAVARFEAATLAGIGAGIATAGVLYELVDRTGFLINAVVYLISLAIYRWGVRESDIRPGSATDAGAVPSPGGTDPDEVVRAVQRFDLGRYRRLLGSTRVFLLAPTWIALNAVIGVWTTQAVFQLINEPTPGFENQLLMGGFGGLQVSIGLAIAFLVFFAGLAYWGERFKRLRRTTIIAIGIAGGMPIMAAVFALNHSAGWPGFVQLGLGIVAAAGLFVLAGATPAALGLLADISEAYPHDRGAIMGLYSVFLAIGQITGSLASGGAAELLGVDGLLLTSVVLLLVALLPVGRLRASEHLLEAAELAAERRRQRAAAAR